jgi:signal transduction histidine kinase
VSVDRAPRIASRIDPEVARVTANLAALDQATRAIAGELDLDRVLQLMVDSVRGLVGARYAALGIVDASGRIERFITSGVSPEERARIGPPPRGHGLLGTIIRDGVTLRIADIAAHKDTYGFPANHPPMHSFLGVPVRIGGRPIGNFYLTEKIGADEFDAQDQDLVEMFAVHAGIAIQNARLHQRVQELAIVEERVRISRDLHDGIIQGIYAVALTLEDVADLMTEDRPEAVARVDRAIDRLNTTIRDIRTFIVGLGATPETSLAMALEAVVAELALDPVLALDLDLADAEVIDGRLSPEATHELLQIAREAISNTARHSGAHSAAMSLRAEDGSAVLRVEDDGRGFDPRRRPGPGHFGLANLHDRASSVGGELTVESEPGRGTRIIVRLPLSHPESPTP